MINISSTNTVAQTVSSCKYIMRPAEAVLVMTTIGGIEPILKQVERFSEYEKIGNRELGIRGRHDAQIMKKLIMSLPNEMEMKEVKTKLEGFLEKSGIGQFPYLACVHRGEKDGIVNRHVHINFFQRRFEAGNSNKERSFVKKTFAEEVRGMYQEAFGFQKNELERVRIPRQEFWKFKENREAIRENRIREASLVSERSKIEELETGAGLVELEKTKKVGLDKLQEEGRGLPKVAVEAKNLPTDPNTEEITEESLAGQSGGVGLKSENKAIWGGPDEIRPSVSAKERNPEIGHPEEPQTAKAVTGEAPYPVRPDAEEERPAKKVRVPKWEVILAEEAFAYREIAERGATREDLERIHHCQRMVITDSSDMVSVAKKLAGQAFMPTIMGVSGESITELQRLSQQHLRDMEQYEQTKRDHEEDRQERSRKLEELAHEELSIQPAIWILGISNEQKRRLEEILIARRKVVEGIKPAPLPPDGRQLKSKLLSLNVQEIKDTLADILAGQDREYQRQEILKEVKKIREQRPEKTAREKGDLIEGFVYKALDKPVGTNQEGLEPMFNFYDNIEEAVTEYISDGSAADDDGLSEQLEGIRLVISRPIIESIAKELEVEESLVAEEFEQVSKQLIYKVIEQAEEQQQRQERKRGRGLDRGEDYGLGRGM